MRRFHRAMPTSFRASYAHELRTFIAELLTRKNAAPTADERGQIERELAPLLLEHGHISRRMAA